MTRRNKADKEEVDSDEDSPVETKSAPGKKQGLNYAAIALMVMFGLPVLLALVVQVRFFKV